MKRYILIFGWYKLKKVYKKIKTASGDQNAGRGVETKWQRLGDLSKRHGDSFMVPGGHYANLEVWRSFLRG